MVNLFKWRGTEDIERRMSRNTIRLSPFCFRPNANQKQRSFIVRHLINGIYSDDLLLSTT